MSKSDMKRRNALAGKPMDELSERREWWVAGLYENAAWAYEDQAEAIANAWASDIANVTHVVELKPGDIVLSKEKLRVAFAWAYTQPWDDRDGLLKATEAKLFGEAKP